MPPLSCLDEEGPSWGNPCLGWDGKEGDTQEGGFPPALRPGRDAETFTVGAAVWVKRGLGLDPGLRCCSHLGALGVLHWAGWGPAPPALCHGGHCCRAGRSPLPWQRSGGLSRSRARPCPPFPREPPKPCSCSWSLPSPLPAGTPPGQRTSPPVPGEGRPQSPHLLHRGTLGAEKGWRISWGCRLLLLLLPGLAAASWARSQQRRKRAAPGTLPKPLLVSPEPGAERKPSPLVELGGSIPAHPAPPPTLPDSS